MLEKFRKKSKTLKQIEKSNLPWRRFLLSLAAVTLLTSCASLGRQFRLEGIDQVVIGTSKMSDVRSLLGDPYAEIDTATWGYKRMHFGDEKIATIWAYVYASGSILGTSAKDLTIDFDKDGKVVDYSFSNTFDGNKTKEPKESERKDFDIFLVRKKIIPRKTTQSEVLSLLGDKYQETTINKPGTKERWIYLYEKKSTDEKVVLPVSTIFSSQNVQVDKIYEKSVFIDFNSNGIVSGVRGESDFPADKDKFFTK